MPVRLHHIVAGAHDLPGPARFWTQAPGWMNLSEREIVIGLRRMRRQAWCFMPVTDPKTVKNRVQITGFFPGTACSAYRFQEWPTGAGPSRLALPRCPARLA